MVYMYRKMLEIRRFEEKVAELYRLGEILGMAHAYIGEEAVAVGACSALEKEDFILSTHRGHGHSIAKGIHPKYLMAELMGKKTGISKGIGGSMHSADPEKGVIFSTAIVGGNIPISVGVALAIKLKKEANVVVPFFGDGATNTEAFHGALNLASLWKLPVIFVCENNLYAISTHVAKSVSAKNIADRAVAYNMPGMIVDGNDVLSVYKATSEAALRAREGNGPTLIECRTYRWMYHGMYFIGEYRTEEEVEEWKKRCPIKSLKRKLSETGTDETYLRKIENEIEEEIENCVKFARESEPTTLEFVKQFVYA